MKALKVICAAAVIALSLSIPTYADSTGAPPPTDPGIIQHPGASSPTPGITDNLSSGDPASPGVASSEPEDIRLSAFMDTLWIVLSIF
jgi:hypothetical protein